MRSTEGAHSWASGKYSAMKVWSTSVTKHFVVTLACSPSRIANSSKQINQPISNRTFDVAMAINQVFIVFLPNNIVALTINLVLFGKTGL
jgi:hypothetical protein